MAKPTPMLQQYLGIKKEFQDTILLFRLGDFYEMFLEDAEVASRELEIVPYIPGSRQRPKNTHVRHSFSCCQQLYWAPDR